MSMPSSARISTPAMLTTRNELIDLSNEPIARVRWARRSAVSPRVNARRPARSGRSAAVVVPSMVSRVNRLMVR